MAAGIPVPEGALWGRSAGPISSSPLDTETMSESWCPW